MGELRSALDALAGEDLTPMFGPQLLDRLRELLVVQNRIAAEVVRTVRECELTSAAEHDGLRSMPSWLRGHGHLAEGEAARIVAAGRALAHLPETAAGFAQGAISCGQVGLIARIAEPDRLAAAADRGIDLGEIDHALAATAAAAPHATVKQAVGHYLDGLDPDGPEPDPTEGRSFTLSKHADGWLSLRGQLDAVGGEKLPAVLESIVQAARPRGDTRSRAQQQADALLQLADNALASGRLPVLRTVRPQLVLTIALADLLDPSTGAGAAATGFGATLSAARARWAGCDAQVPRIVLDPDGLPLDVGRAQRVVPPHLRRAVKTATGTACSPAAPPPPTGATSIMRPLPGTRGEPASRGEGVVLSHTKVHHGFRIQRDPGGRWHTYRPDNTKILIGPRPWPDVCLLGNAVAERHGGEPPGP